MAQMTRANGPIVPCSDPSPLFGPSSTLDGVAADVQTTGTYDAEKKEIYDQARTERRNPAGPSN